MKTLAMQLDKNKPLEAVLADLEAQYPPADKLLETYSQLVERILGFVKTADIVTFPEDEEVNVTETPKIFQRYNACRSLLLPGPL